jgi:ankyrin repeat protein
MTAMQGLLIMHAAARDGDTVTVRTQLSTAGALSLINTQDASGATPLYWAAQNGHASVTEQLIEARCNVDLQAKDGSAPLHLAGQNGHASVTVQLIQACCKHDLQMSDGRTPLYISAQRGTAAITKLLIEARCNLDLLAKDGRTALYAAAESGQSPASHTNALTREHMFLSFSDRQKMLR